MPYLSWMEAGGLRRQELAGSLLLGRDPHRCIVAAPLEETVSRAHAEIARSGAGWRLRDLDSRNGTTLNGLPLTAPIGCALQDGDEIALGDWRLTYTDAFPGLDGVDFVEGVGDLFAEVRPEARQALILARAVELLQRSSETLLREGSSPKMLRGLLAEALKLTSADRGFVVLLEPDGSQRQVAQAGDLEEDEQLSRSVVEYVRGHGVAVLSNAPLRDPRFGGESLVHRASGALLCAPLAVDGDLKGVVYLDRQFLDRPFTRFDLALLQAFVRQSALALRHTELVLTALLQAELQGEYVRLRTQMDRLVRRLGDLFVAMGSSLRWIQSYADNGYGDLAVMLRHQAGRLQHLVECGLQEALQEGPREVPNATSLEVLQRALEPVWRELAVIRGLRLDLQAAPQGRAWVAFDLAAQALLGLVEPLLMQAEQGGPVTGRWLEQPADWTLRLGFGAGLTPPAPDPWTLRALKDAGIRWHWSEQRLALDLPKDLGAAPADATPALGLVTGAGELVSLFEGLAQAEALGLHLLDPDPPRHAGRRFTYLVVDAQGTEDPAACVEAYRRHPRFATTPILVVRAGDELFPELLAAGATDCLPTGFRWESLHNRLQVLKGHDELQRKARAAERLDSFRQMAGTLKHEINNPLAVISMQIELLSRKYPEEPKLQKVMEMVERIRDLVQVLQKMRETPSEDYPGGESILKLG